MAEEKTKNYRYLGKVKTKVFQDGGSAQSILMDNINHVNKDGTENQYYIGTLLWLDKKTGKTFRIKQMNLHIPRDGFKQSDLDRGVNANVVVDLENEYHVDIVE